MRPEKNSKGSSLPQSLRNEDLSFSVLPGHSSLLILEKSCVALVPKRDSSRNSNLTGGVNCSQNTASKSSGARKSQNQQGGIGGMTQPIAVVYVPFGWLGATVSFDLLLWSRMFHFHCRSIWRRVRTLQSGHTVIRADRSPDGWQLPEITELRQNND